MENKKSFLNTIGLFFIIVLVVFAVVNLVLTGIINFDIKKKGAEEKEKARPANLELTIIIDSTCKTCFDLSPVIDKLTSKNVRITSKKSLELNTKEAQDLIQKYEIKKAPVFLVTGELNKNEEIKSFFNENGEIKDNTFIFTKIKPPYLIADTGEIRGEVILTYLRDSTCKQCRDLTDLISRYKSAGISIKETKTIERKSEDGKKLISQFALTKVPTLIFSSELKDYEDIASNLGKYNLGERDGSYLLSETLPPYLDLKTNKIRGLVNLTLISDINCKECYDVNNHVAILKGFGINPVDDRVIDISTSEGKKLLKKYKINFVPTFILTGDIDVYENLKNIWNQVGTIEKDGAHVFREGVKLMGVYKDLSSGEVVKPQSQK